MFGSRFTSGSVSGESSKAAFGATSSPLSSMTAFESTPCSAFGSSTPAFGSSFFNQNCGSASQQTQSASHENAFNRSSVFGPQGQFNFSTATVSPSGATTVCGFGGTSNTSASIFSNSAPVVCRSPSAFGNSYLCGSTLFGTQKFPSGFGHSVVDGVPKGNRVTCDAATKENDGTGAKIESLCAMDSYLHKSHEELRFEDYQSGDKGESRHASQTLDRNGPFTSWVTPSSSSVAPSGTSLFPSPVCSNPFFPQIPSLGSFGISRSRTTGLNPALNPFTSLSSPYISASETSSVKFIGSGGSSVDFIGPGGSRFGSQTGGSRLTSYNATLEEVGSNGTISGSKIESISAMPAYINKCHEELRSEDYQLSDKGGFKYMNQSTAGVGVSSSTPPAKPFGFQSVGNHSSSEPCYPGGFKYMNQSTAGVGVSSSTPPAKPFGFQSVGNHSSSEPCYPSSSTLVPQIVFGPPCAGVSATNSQVPSQSTGGISVSSTATRAQLFSSPSVGNHTSSSTPYQSSNTLASQKVFVLPGTEVAATGSQIPSLNYYSSNQLAPQIPPFSSLSFNVSTAELNSTSSNMLSSKSPFQTSSLSSISNSGTLLHSTSRPQIPSSRSDLSGSPFSLSSSFLKSTPAPEISSASNNQPAQKFQFFAPRHGHMNILDGSSTTSSCFQQNRSSSSPVGLNPWSNLSSSTAGLCSSDVMKGVDDQSVEGQPPSIPNTEAMQQPPVTNPFGSQNAVQISVNHPVSSISIQYGISSRPVSDNPAPVRRSSLLRVRQMSRSRNWLLTLKYNAKSNGPKVPFFADEEKTKSNLKADASIIPMDNPRSWIHSPSKEWVLSDDSEKLSEVQSTIKNLQENSVESVIPNLRRADYYSEPSIQELAAKEKSKPGFCRHVKNFVVGRHGYGIIKFLDETDIMKLDLDAHIQFNFREVIVYMDESKRPPVGQGLNKPAEITLLNVKCISKKTGKQYIDGPKVDQYREMLIRKATEQGAEFISFDPALGEWKFKVQHF